MGIQHKGSQLKTTQLGALLSGPLISEVAQFLGFEHINEEMNNIL